MFYQAEKLVGKDGFPSAAYIVDKAVKKYYDKDADIPQAANRSNLWRLVQQKRATAMPLISMYTCYTSWVEQPHHTLETIHHTVYTSVVFFFRDNLWRTLVAPLPLPVEKKTGSVQPMDQSRKGTKAFGDSRLALTPEFNTFSLHHQPSGKEDNGRRNENGRASAYYIDL